MVFSAIPLHYIFYCYGQFVQFRIFMVNGFCYGAANAADTRGRIDLYGKPACKGRVIMHIARAISIQDINDLSAIFIKKRLMLIGNKHIMQ